MAQEFQSLEKALSDHYKEAVFVRGKKPVYGGDINQAYCLDISNGERAFLKTNRLSFRNMFRTEARGLRALYDARKIGVPEVYGFGTDPSRKEAFLLMEFLDSGRQTKDYWEQFGRELAALHRFDTGTGDGEELPRYGWEEDNFIGSSPQKNTWKNSFIEFFRDCRLLPQIRMAENVLSRPVLKKADQLLDHLDHFLVEPDFPSLVHGDLWSGNAICGPDGKAWILDPAAYIGFFEADLAMTELFGRFPARFYQAYHETNPVAPEYRDRQKIYDLYHMLNHLNLFGTGYLGAVVSILNHYV